MRPKYGAIYTANKFKDLTRLETESRSIHRIVDAYIRRGRGVIFAQTQTSDLGVCHLRLVGVVVQRDVNKF